MSHVDSVGLADNIDGRADFLAVVVERVRASFIPYSIGLIWLLYVSRTFRFWRALLGQFLTEHSFEPTHVGFVVGAIQVLCVLGVCVYLIEHLGFSSAAILTPIGVGVGFALQSILSSAASGLLLLVWRPFEYGHRILVTIGGATVECTVILMDIMSTHVDTTDNRRLLIPNAAFFSATSAIQNLTANAWRRCEVDVSVCRSASVASTRAVLQRAALTAHRISKTAIRGSSCTSPDCPKPSRPTSGSVDAHDETEWLTTGDLGLKFKATTASGAPKGLPAPDVLIKEVSDVRTLWMVRVWGCSLAQDVLRDVTAAVALEFLTAARIPLPMSHVKALTPAVPVVAPVSSETASRREHKRSAGSRSSRISRTSPSCTSGRSSRSFTQRSSSLSERSRYTSASDTSYLRGEEEEGDESYRLGSAEPESEDNTRDGACVEEVDGSAEAVGSS